MSDIQFIISFMIFYLGLVGCWFWCKFCKKTYRITPVANNLNVLVNNFVTPQTNTRVNNLTTSQTPSRMMSEKSHVISINDIQIGFTTLGYVRKPQRIYQMNIPV